MKTGHPSKFGYMLVARDQLNGGWDQAPFDFWESPRGDVRAFPRNEIPIMSVDGQTHRGGRLIFHGPVFRNLPPVQGIKWNWQRARAS